jgi:hypothetical protein
MYTYKVGNNLENKSLGRRIYARTRIILMVVLKKYGMAMCPESIYILDEVHLLGCDAVWLFKNLRFGETIISIIREKRISEIGTVAVDSFTWMMEKVRSPKRRSCKSNTASRASGRNSSYPPYNSIA